MGKGGVGRGRNAEIPQLRSSVVVMVMVDVVGVVSVAVGGRVVCFVVV